MSIASALIKAGSKEGPLSNSEREELERVVLDRNRRGPLSEENLRKLARFSHRQLKRLNKRHLTETDRQILKTIQEKKGT